MDYNRKYIRILNTYAGLELKSWVASNSGDISKGKADFVND